MLGVSFLVTSVTFKLNKLRTFSKDGANIPVSYSCLRSPSPMMNTSTVFPFNA